MPITHSDIDWDVSRKAGRPKGVLAGTGGKAPPKQSVRPRGSGAVDGSAVQQKQASPTEFRFTRISIVEPPQGFERNKPFEIEGAVERVAARISRPRILLYPVGHYGGESDEFVPGGIEVFVDTATFRFRGTCKYLHDPEPYASDEHRPSGATWELGVRAEAQAAERSGESERLTFPRESRFVTLRKNDYDDTGAGRYGKPRSGENYRLHGVVKALQTDLAATGFLARGSEDGFFGEQTHEAVCAFQECAIGADRMKRTVGKAERTGTTLDQAAPDGVVGKKTRDELDRWLQNDWVKPMVVLRKGDVDDEGVRAVMATPGSEEHHEGEPVVEAQKKLAGVEAYLGKLDGWFGDRTKAAVTTFQKWAAQGQFLIDGVLTDIEERLTNYRPGTIDANTRAMLAVVVEKGGRVPEEPQMRFPLPSAHRDRGYHTGARAFGSNRTGGRAHAGCDLYGPAGTMVYAIADGVVESYYDYYWQTYALVVNHGGRLALYGEVQPPRDGHGYTDDIPPAQLRNGLPPGVAKGALVKRGDHIAYVGQLRPLDEATGKRKNHTATMVHFEMYAGTAAGGLTDKANSVYDNVANKGYKRRRDLLDPTEILDAMNDT